MSRSPDIYARAVNGGSGDGAYTNGTAVPITADASAAHYKFDRWIGDTNTVADVFAAYETSVSGSGTVTFWWRVSSESDADYLKFLVDGTQIVAISGTKGPWAQVSQRIEGAGVSHTLRWEYAKNGSLASSTDAGWVDDIVWTGDVPEPVLAPDIQTAAVTNGVLGIRFLGERGIPYTVYSNATLQASGWALMQPVPQEEGEIKGERRVKRDKRERGTLNAQRSTLNAQGERKKTPNAEEEMSGQRCVGGREAVERRFAHALQAKQVSRVAAVRSAGCRPTRPWPRRACGRRCGGSSYTSDPSSVLRAGTPSPTRPTGLLSAT